MPKGATLTIDSYSGTGSEDGSLTASATARGGSAVGGAGIGAIGYGETSNGVDATVRTVGAIIINGGTITATGADGGAGIGGGLADRVESVQITGGTVHAASNGYPAAIGAGYANLGTDTSPISCGTISITGGTVTVGGNIGYSSGPSHSGGSVNISESANVTFNSGTIAAGTQNVAMVDAAVTIYDARLSDGSVNVTFSASGIGRTATGTLDVSDYKATSSNIKLIVPYGTTELIATWGNNTATATISPSDTAISFGKQLHPVKLLLADDAFATEGSAVENAALIVKQDGATVAESGNTPVIYTEDGVTALETTLDLAKGNITFNAGKVSYTNTSGTAVNDMTVPEGTAFTIIQSDNTTVTSHTTDIRRRKLLCSDKA